MGEEECMQVIVGKPKGNKPLRIPRLGSAVALGWILGSLDGVVGTRLIFLRLGTSGWPLLTW
jgi:hypothetical protein